MSFSENLQFITTIEPTYENAKAIQKLTLQDVKTGGFKNPLQLADPSNANMVAAQQQKLSNHPERYSGYTRDGELVAYVKQNDWLIGDELPFASEPRAVVLKVRRALHLNPSTGQWGIFGLVASDDFVVSERRSVLEGLLMHTLKDPRAGEFRKFNIVIHKYDPLLEIAMHHGFVPVGKQAEAIGAPGLKQQRYQLSVFQ